MKKLVLFILLIISNICYSINYISNASGDWSTPSIWTPNGIPGSGDNVTITNSVTIIRTGNLDMGIAWSTAMSLTVNLGGILTINGNLTELSGTRDVITINGRLNINGNLIQNQGANSGAVDRSYLTNNGIININGGDYSNSQNTTFNNNGTLTIINGNFTTNQSSVFINNGVVTIDNTGYSLRTISFSNLNYSNDILLNINSVFNVIKSNINMTGYGGPLNVNGKINITDGNITESFGSFNIGSSGGVNTTDTDNNGDGVLNLNGGGATITNNGISYITSLSTSGGGVTITDNNILFIRNLSVGNFDDGNNVLNVSSTGKLYYCSNPVRQEMWRGILGTVASGGKLYYTNEIGSYPTTTPNLNQGGGQPEQDFNVSNNDQIVMSSIGLNSCADAFKYRLSPPLPIELITFIVKKNNGNIILNWVTASETNNEYFTIYKSKNGVDFFEIGKVDGAGTSSEIKYYSYSDCEEDGCVYYKIRQTDYDGKYEDSKILSICNTNDIFYISPNPSSIDDIKITFKKIIKDILIQCYDIKGVLMFEELVTNPDNPYYFGRGHLINVGEYFLKVRYDNKIYIKNIIIN